MKQTISLSIRLILLLLFIGCSEPVNINKGDNSSGNNNPGNNDDNNNNGNTTPTLRETKLDKLFDNSTVGEITLSFSVEEWNKLLTNFDNNYRNSIYVKGNFSFTKGEKSYVMNDVGIRIRGNGSRVRPEGDEDQLHSSANPNYHQAPFKVKFTEYFDDDVHHLEKAMKGINLKFMKNDPAYVQEIYSYDLFKRYGIWTAPRAAYTKLYIKIGNETPAYFGMYKAVEEINKQFLKARVKDGQFSGDEGNLWKCLYQMSGPANLKNENLNNKIGIETDTWTPTYDLKTNEDTGFAAAKTEFSTFIAQLNSKTGNDFQTWISSKMDMDLFLKTLAVNVTVGMWDDYWRNSNNYYLYFDADGKIFFIPYDYDNTLGMMHSDFNPVEDPFNWGKGNFNGSPLVSKILAIPAYKEKYQSYLKELIDPTKDLFYVTKSQARVKKWQDLITPFLPPTLPYATDAEWISKDNPGGIYNLLGNNNETFFIAKAKSIDANSTIPSPVVPLPGNLGELLGYRFEGESVIFTLDPNQYQLDFDSSAITEVVIRGGFNGWASEDPKMSLAKSGNVWTGTFSKTPVLNGEFKFYLPPQDEWLGTKNKKTEYQIPSQYGSDNIKILTY